MKTRIDKHGERFVIKDINGIVIDDCNGYGYKTNESAKKASYYRFSGGKEKIEEINTNFEKWKKDNFIKYEEAKDYIEAEMWYGLKNGDSKIEINKKINNYCNKNKIPDFVLRNILK